MIECQSVILQRPVLASKLTPHPRYAPLVDFPHSQRSATLEKSFVCSPSHRREVVAGLIELSGHSHETDTIADPQCAPRFVHPVQDTTQALVCEREPQSPRRAQRK